MPAWFHSLPGSTAAERQRIVCKFSGPLSEDLKYILPWEYIYCWLGGPTYRQLGGCLFKELGSTWPSQARQDRAMGPSSQSPVFSCNVSLLHN